MEERERERETARRARASKPAPLDVVPLFGFSTGANAIGVDYQKTSSLKGGVGQTSGEEKRPSSGRVKDLGDCKVGGCALWLFDDGSVQ